MERLSCMLQKHNSLEHAPIRNVSLHVSVHVTKEERFPSQNVVWSTTIKEKWKALAKSLQKMPFYTSLCKSTSSGILRSVNQCLCKVRGRCKTFGRTWQFTTELAAYGVASLPLKVPKNRFFKGNKFARNICWCILVWRESPARCWSQSWISAEYF